MGPQPAGSGFTAIAMGANFLIALHSTAEEDVLALQDAVDQLIALGAVLPANGNSLRAKLNAVLAALPGDPATARASLQAFINQVTAFTKTGRLAATEGQALIDAARAIISQLAV